VGPHRVELREGERAVLVLGAVQVRAQVVPFEVPAPRFKVTAATAAWVALLGLVYAAAIAYAAASGHPAPSRAEPGGMGRIHERFLPKGP
jgi:hypothetical protein